MTSSDREWDPQPVQVVSLLLLLTVIGLRSFLSESFWLDETLSVWVAGAPTPLLIERAVTFQGQSPLYYWVLSWWGALFGWSELPARSLSVVFLAGAAYQLGCIAERLLGASSRITTVIIFILCDPILISMSVRPYAMALFGAVYSFRLFLELLATPTRWRMVGYALVLTLTGYVHYLFLLIVIPKLLWLLRTNTHAWRVAAGAWGLAALLLLPTVPQLLTLAGRASELSFARPPSPLDIAGKIVPPYIAVYLGVALALGVLWTRGGTWSLSSIQQRLAFTLLLSLSIPPLLLAGVAWVGGPVLTLERYLLWIYPFLALLGALVISALSTPRARALALITLTLFAGVRELARVWQVEEWRGVVTSLRELPPAPLLVYSGLIESRSTAKLLSLTQEEYLLAPLRTYQYEGTAVPIGGGAPEPELFDQRIRNLMASHNQLRILYLDAGSLGEERSEDLRKLLQFFAEQGYTEQHSHTEGQVKLFTVERLTK